MQTIITGRAPLEFYKYLSNQEIKSRVFIIWGEISVIINRLPTEVIFKKHQYLIEKI